MIDFNLVYNLFFDSEIKVYSSDLTKPIVKEKPIGMVDMLVKSILNMIKLFQNSEFVNLILLYKSYLFTISKLIFLRFCYTWKINYKNCILNL